MKHKEVKHVHKWEVCQDKLVGDFNFVKRKKLVLLNSESLLSEKEFEELD